MLMSRIKPWRFEHPGIRLRVFKSEIAPVSKKFLSVIQVHWTMEMLSQ